MPTKNTAEIIIKAFDQASAVLQRLGVNAQKQMENVKKSTDVANKSLGYMKTMAAGVAVGFGVRGTWNWLIDTNSKMEQAQIGFETMLGSAQKSQKFLAELQEFAAKTPFEFTELRTAATRMLAFGFEAEKILPTLTAVGDAISALGMGQEGINRVIVALGQMRAKAKVSAEEMMQLTEAGIPAWDILAKAMGKSTAEVMKLSEKGAIPAKAAIDALVKGMEERFPDMMKKQSETLGGMLSNIKDYSDMAGRTLGKGIFEQVKPAIKSAMDSLNQLTKSGDLERWGQNIGKTFEFASKHAKDFLAITAGMGTMFVFNRAIEGMAVALTSLRTAQILATASTKGLTAALLSNPIGLIAAGLGVVVGGLVLYKTRASEAAVSTSILSQEQRELTESYLQAKSAADKSTLSIENKSSAMQTLGKETEKVGKILPDLLKMYGEEALAMDISTGKITENTSAYIRNLAVKASAAQAELEQLELRQYLQNRVKGPWSYFDASMDPEIDKKVGEARTKSQSLGAALSASMDSVGKITEKTQQAVNKLDFGNTDTQKEKLLSLGSVFTQVSQAIATGSKTSLFEAKDALEDLASAAEKLENGKGAGLAEAIRGTFDQLPAIVEDKTGETGKVFLRTLYNMFADASGVFEDGGNKINIQFDLAMAKFIERMDETRKEAQKKAREIAMAMEDAMDKASKIYDDMQKSLAQANENYATETAKVREKMNEDIKKLAEDFDKTLADRAESLKNWAGLFDEVPDLVKDSMSKMTKNLRDQVDRFDLFYQMIGALAKKGVDKGLIDELRQMGPKATPQLMALYQATDEELQEYVNLWKTRGELAGDEAEDQLEDTRDRMLAAQQKIRQDAHEELSRLKTEWKDRLREIRDEVSDRLSEVVSDAQDKGTAFMVNLLNSIRSKYPELSQLISQIVDSMNINIPTPNYEPYEPPSGGGGGSGGEGYPSGGIVPGTGYPEGSIVPGTGESEDSSGPSQSESDWWNSNFGYVPSSVDNVYHEGGEVTQDGRRPLSLGEVPIIAQEGEIVFQPQRGTPLDFTRMVGLLEKILDAVRENAGIKFDQLSRIDTVNIYDKQDTRDLTRGLARDILVAVGGVG